jgi:hypothetical protein
MNKQSRSPIPFDQPGNYQIKVLGQIDPTWSDRLQGMTICQKLEAGRPLTNLEGELLDQAALAGVLMTLYELHLTLLSVRRLEKG